MLRDFGFSEQKIAECTIAMCEQVEKPPVGWHKISPEDYRKIIKQA